MGVANSIVTTKLPTEKRLRIDLAVVRQGLRRGDFVLTWLPSRANLADALTKEAENDLPRLRPCSHMKKPLLDALRSGCSNLRGVRQETKGRLMCLDINSFSLLISILSGISTVIMLSWSDSRRIRT
jgi:hypothetical protein